MTRYDDELLWWVRYVTHANREAYPAGEAPRDSAFFYACTEAEVRQKVANWQRWYKCGGLDIESIEQVPHGFHLRLRNELPPAVPTRPLDPSDPLYDALSAQVEENRRVAAEEQQSTADLASSLVHK